MATKKSKNLEPRTVIAYIPSLKYKPWDSSLSYQLRSSSYQVSEPVINFGEIPTKASKIPYSKRSFSEYYRLSKGDLQGNFYTRDMNTKLHPNTVLKHRVQYIYVPDRSLRRAVHKGFEKSDEIIDDIDKKNKKLHIPKLPSQDRHLIATNQIDKELERLAIRTRARRRKSGETSLKR